MNVIHSTSLANGRFEGAGDGPANIPIILSKPQPGGGPRLHRHLYDETWVIERGNLLFQVGDRLAQARAGDIVVAPPGVRHRFTNQAWGGRG
jgi:mannose-6-phosphate isomerase-like protein (cupin superfamily)